MSIIVITAVIGVISSTSGCVSNSVSSPMPGDAPSSESGAASGATSISTTTSSTSQASDELIAAVGIHGGEPEAGFNPITGWGDNHEPLVQSTLLKKDSKANLINDLATNYTVSSDGLKWTVKIRNDVKFHDGTPLTAKDVAFTFNTAANSSAGVDLSMLKKATATDDYTVEFELNDPQATFVNKFTEVGIVPEHAYNENYGMNPIGSGPYKFVQWDKGTAGNL